MSEQKPNWAGLILLALCGWWVASLFSSSSPKPAPDPAPPTPVISSEMDAVTQEADRLLQRHIRDVIQKLERGELTDERETRDLLAAGVKASRDAAWQPVKDRDVTAFADGWTPQKQIQRLRQIIGER
jgi:hypothetical protein